MRIHTTDTLLLVIDVQERLLPAMAEGEATLGRIVTLIEGMQLLEVPVLVSEQYPKGLGTTVASVKEKTALAPVFSKPSFSCWDDPEIRKALEASGKRSVVLCGIEAHVCVLQTALDLVEAGYRVVVTADAVTSRKVGDRDLALARMAREGVVVTGTESLLFELTRAAGTDLFKAISRLVK